MQLTIAQLAYDCLLKHCLRLSESMHIHKSSFVGGFRILVDHQTPAVSAGLGCGFGTRVVSDVLPWQLDWILEM